MSIAFSDLDYTLIGFDSDTPGATTFASGQGGPPGLYAKNDRFYADYRAGKLVMADYLRFAWSRWGACLWRKS